MPKHYENMYVECPFFHYYDGVKLACEGVEDKASTHLVFSSPEDRRNYMKTKCYVNHKDCIMAQALYNYKYNNTKE